MRGSVLAKMIGLYMLMVFMFLGVVGSVLLEACRKEISDVRIELLSSRASAVVKMAVRFEDPDDYTLQGFLQSIANEFDAVIQIYDGEGNYLCGTDAALIGLSVSKDENAKLNQSVLNRLLQDTQDGAIYVKADYFIPRYSSRYSTVAVSSEVPFSESEKRIVILHSDESVIYDSYYKILGGIWVPLAAVMIFSVILIIMTNYRMVLPLTQMNAAAKAIANDNFSKRIYVNTRDEVGQLAKSFNKMAEELSSTDTMRKDFVANAFKEEKINVYADQGGIEQVLVNLLDNAIKFTPQGGQISLSSCIKEGKAVIAVKDTGSGIKADILPHIWERFYTENKSRTGSKGVGLGLSIVKRIMVQHGQDITAQSEENKGSVFTFTLELAHKNKSKTTGE